MGESALEFVTSWLPSLKRKLAWAEKGTPKKRVKIKTYKSKIEMAQWFIASQEAPKISGHLEEEEIKQAKSI